LWKLLYYDLNKSFWSIFKFFINELISIYLYFKAVKVKPKSIQHKFPVTSCNTGFMEIPADKINTPLNITYSYSIQFEVSFKYLLSTLLFIQ